MLCKFFDITVKNYQSVTFSEKQEVVWGFPYEMSHQIAFVFSQQKVKVPVASFSYVLSGI